MASKSRTGPPERNRRTPKRSASRPAARRSNTATEEALQAEARTILRDLEEAGGRFEIREGQYKLRVLPEGQRARCRALLARANGRLELQAAIKVKAFCLIARTALGLAEAP